MPEDKIINVRFNSRLVEKLEEFSREWKETQSYIIRRAVTKYIDENKSLNTKELNAVKNLAGDGI